MKGRPVNPPAHTAKPASPPKAGRFAALGGLLRLGGALTLTMLAWTTPAALGAEPPPKTVARMVGCNGVDHTSFKIGFEGGIVTQEETHWSLEYAESVGGPWSPVPGGQGTITEAEAKAAPANEPKVSPVVLAGLTPEVRYYVRGVLKDASGETVEEAREGVRGGTLGCETVPLHPEPGSAEVLGVSGTSAHVHSKVFPDGFETRWRFEYEASLSKLENGEGLPGSEGTITLLEAEATPFDAGVSVEGDLSGLSAGGTYYVRVFAEDEPEWPPKSGVTSRKEAVSGAVTFETAGAPVVSTFVVHALHGESVRVLGGVVPHGYDTHYHFEYVSSEEYAASGWAGAASAPPVDVGAGEFVQGKGFPSSVVGEDLPGLVAGGSYEYRLVATNTSPGDPVVAGEGKALTVPAAPAPGVEAPCENARVRTGPSAVLPDCRAYEQLTPVDKEGAQEIYSYGIGFSGSGALPAVDGESVVVNNPLVAWGLASGDGQSPYRFARSSAGSDWLMRAAAAQPETGVGAPKPRLYNADQSQLAFETSVETVIGGSPAEIEYKVGPVGGPYRTVASIPGKDRLEGDDGWVASSEDFSKLILEVADHTLLGPSTKTTSGNDLYEYAAGQLHQVNVTGGSPGSAISSCGAVIVHGREGGEGGVISSPRAVSADGSRVFFEQVPGSDCGEPPHLYVRVGGDETVDIGAYSFLAASGDGSRVLLVKRAGETREVMLYDSETKTVKPLQGFVAHEELEAPLVSTDLSTVYFSSRERLTPEAPALAAGGEADLYRYDVATETLSFVSQTAGINGGEEHASPEGRYFYFDTGGVVGLPGGSLEPLRNNENSTRLDGHQVYRFDSAEDVVECMSCASSFDPEPRTGAFFGLDQGSGTLATQDGMPAKTVSSANGEYAFFETPADLVPQDIDGEVAPETNRGEHLSTEQNTSVSSDVYEWREDGVHGCTLIQGCLSLITSGTGGFLNLMIGSTESADDVFFYTSSQLAPTDDDTAGDVYDARVDGGFPPPPPAPVECEGDACSTPASPPNDATPSSFTFQGTGNVVAEPATPVKAKKTKAKTKKTKKTKGKRKTKNKKATRKPATKASKRTK